MMGFALLTLAGVPLLLLAEARSLKALKWVAKPLASLGFVGAAVVAGALDTPYGAAVLVALLLSTLGDVLLIPEGAKGAFLGGLGAFLLAHVAFAVAFWVRGVDLAGVGAALPVLGVFGVVVGRWLLPHVKPSMKGPVVAYIVAIAAMVMLAAGAFAAGAPRLLGVAAVTFLVSDLFVARQRFVTPGLVNRVFGLPLYYGAQLAFAWTLVPA